MEEILWTILGELTQISNNQITMDLGIPNELEGLCNESKCPVLQPQEMVDVRICRRRPGRRPTADLDT